MKLIFYSGGNHTINEKIDLDLISLIGKKNPKIGYIPSSSDLQRKYFNEVKNYYAKYGVSQFLYFDLDKEFDKSKIPQLKDCDAIHLSGGNTFYFLYSIKKRKFLKFLREYAKSGKILIGVSAGAIIMTPSINTTLAFHPQTGDLDKLNTAGLKNFNALHLVNFEFIPHFDEKEKEVFAKNYSQKRKNPIYACNDGSGIIVNEKKTIFYGKVFKF